MTGTYRNFIHNPEHGFIFAYVPKVACTNWKSVLCYMEGKTDWLDQRVVHDPDRSGLHYLGHDQFAQDLCADPTVKRYAMVRDPYSRSLSAYLDKIERNIGLIGKPFQGDYFQFVAEDVERFRRFRLDTVAYPAVSFELYLLWLRDGGSRFTGDEHWARQVDLLRHPTVAFDFIGRFESFSSDSEKLLALMGCDQPLPSREMLNFPATKAAEKLATYFTPLAQSLVEQVYAADFAAFNYPLWDQRPVVPPKPAYARKPRKVPALDALSRLMIPTRTVIDVGVQYGTPELMEVYPDKLHVLVEPVEEFLRTLAKRYAKAGIQTLLVPVAAADADGEMTLRISTVSATSEVTHARLVETAAGARDRITPVRKLDTIASEHALQGPFLLKIDVDGAEDRVLQGATEVLKQTNIVVVEAHVDNFLQRSQPLLDAGFGLFDIVDLCYYDWRLSQFDLIFIRSEVLAALRKTLFAKGFDMRKWHDAGM